MGVYIKGMKMPKSCSECKLFDASRAIGLFSPLGWCRVNGNEIFRLSEKADFCPLISVPDHGGLIDKRKVVQKVYDYCHTADGKYCGPDDVGELWDEMKAMPAIIEASTADKEGEE